MPTQTTIIIPTYNEKGNISILTEEILKLHPDFHIIVVDDNGTGAIIDELAKKDSRIQTIHRPFKMGLGSAYVEGFKAALANGSDLIFEMDADFSHEPEHLKEFINASKKTDVIIGSRYQNGIRVSGWRFRRLILSKFANIFVSYVMVKPVWDFTSGYRCYRRKVLETIDLDRIKSDGYAFQIEMTHLCFKHGFSVKEIPIIFKARKYGRSKFCLQIIFEALGLMLRSRAPATKMLRHLTFILMGKIYINGKNRSQDK